MPTVFLPGIGATMRTLGTRRAIARSSARPVILRQPQAGFELDFVLGDDRAGFDFDDADVEAEVLERLFEDLGFAADFLLVLFVADVLVRQQQVERRQLVVGFVSSGCWSAASSCSMTTSRSVFGGGGLAAACGWLLGGGLADAEGGFQAVGKLGGRRRRFALTGIAPGCCGGLARLRRLRRACGL